MIKLPKQQKEGGMEGDFSEVVNNSSIPDNEIEDLYWKAWDNQDICNDELLKMLILIRQFRPELAQKIDGHPLNKNDISHQGEGC